MAQALSSVGIWLKVAHWVGAALAEETVRDIFGGSWYICGKDFGRLEPVRQIVLELKSRTWITWGSWKCFL